MSGTGYSFSLDMNFDNLPKLAAFGAWPSGAYLIELENGIEHKEINKANAMTVTFKLIETKKLEADALEEGENPPNPGDSTSIAFMMDNETGAGFFQRFLEPVVEHFKTGNIRELMVKSKGLKMLVLLKKIHGKGNNEGKVFNQIVDHRVV